MCHPTVARGRVFLPFLFESLWGFGKKRHQKGPGRYMWVVKVGAGLPDGGDSCSSLWPSETSPVAWFLVPSGGEALSPRLGSVADVWRKLGRGGQGSKLLLPPGLSWAAHGLCWACPCIGSRRCLLCWGLGLCQDKGACSLESGDKCESDLGLGQCSPGLYQAAARLLLGVRMVIISFEAQETAGLQYGFFVAGRVFLVMGLGP